MRNKEHKVVVSFVAASSNSGKTTLIEKIVRRLKARGLRVAVIKHASKGFDLDRPGKDSWRFQAAGADEVMLVGPGKTALFRTIDREPGFEELERLVDADVVLYEGFKKQPKNKIEVFRSGISGNQPLCVADSSYIALVSDGEWDVSIPWFDLNDAEGVSEFILRRTLTK